MGEIFLDRGLLLGIVGGLTVFIAICSFILLNPSDFDEQLIMQVDRGVPAHELITQIDEETVHMQIKAKKRLDAVIMDRRFWGNGDLDSPDNYVYYVTDYETEMKLIKEYKNTRIRFAKREITKEEFLNLIKDKKDFFSQR